MKKYILVFLAAIGLLSCKPTQNLSTVEKVDINRYSGQWYEIARLPNSFEKDLKCVTATYTLKSNDKIEVLNQGYSIENSEKLNTAKGTAWLPDAEYPGRLKVSFFWPFAGDYYIISLDENYAYALVGDPSRKFLWILSRSKTLDYATYSELIGIAKSHGFETDDIITVKQDCDN